jgi:NTP pyrophosphatase (non-canonical NTP hydrolase)
MKTNKDLKLRTNPTLADFQKYEKEMEEVRGFSEQTVVQKCLLLGEEVGELFKAVRKTEGFIVDNKNSKFGDIPEELIDVFMFVLSIAYKYDIDLEQAFRAKEEVNKKREWE